MRLGTDNYETARRQKVIELRTVVQINFGDLVAPDYVYLTSHDDVVVPGATTLIAGVVKDVSSLSQKLNPLEATAEIGAVDFSVIDRNAQLTTLLAMRLVAQKGLRNKTVCVFSGARGLAWADYKLVQTQIASKLVSYDDGTYKIACEDIQRTLKKDLFVPAKTKLAISLPAPNPANPDQAFTVTVLDTSLFQPCVHGSSFTDAPGQTVYYFRIKYENGYEVLRATGKTATTFTGCTRARLGTIGYAHTVTGPDSAPDVEEYIYLEMPAPMAAYVLLTGQRPTQPGFIVPDNWHLGISPDFVDAQQFLSIGDDLYNPSDESVGFILRFEALTKEDGKRFIEKQVMALCGAFMPIGADGKLGMRRQIGVLTDASYVAALDETNVIKYGDLQQDLKAVCNDITIDWGYLERNNTKQYYHHDRLLDTVSSGVQGVGQPMTLQFRGLHVARHTFSTIRNRFDLLRDRYAGPPLKLSVDVLPSMGFLQVGDIVRVKLSSVRDYAGNTITLDRSMEIQSIRLDVSSQVLRLELFGSSAKAAPIKDGANYVLPDSAYTTGTALTTIVGIDANGLSTGNGNIPAGVYYYNGDLTLQAIHTWTINGTVWLYVRGRLTVAGKVDGKGRSGATGAGYFGTTIATGKVKWHKSHGDVDVYSWPGVTIKGVVDAVPIYDLVNTGTVRGVPAALNGSKGGYGGDGVWDLAGNVGTYYGKAGGNGGAGLGVVSRGILFGASGKIDTSGNDGVAPISYIDGDSVVVAGGGAGGAPGAVVFLLDGGSAAVPVLDGYLDCSYGHCTLVGNRPSGPNGVDNNKEPYHSYYEGRPRENVWQSATRVQYIPQQRATSDIATLGDPRGIVTFVQPTKPNYYDCFALAQRNFIDGDLWFDSDAGNHPYRYSVSAGDFTSMQDADIAAAQLTADNAATVASSAQTNATAALNQLSDIANDGKLTPNEKAIAVRDFTDCTNEKPSIESQADAYAITTEKTAYTTAYNALNTYLGNLSPAWNDTATTTTIVTATFNSKWNGYYSARQVLLNKIADEAGKRATWSLIPDRPQTLYALDAASAAAIETRSATALFADVFANQNTLSEWQEYNGSGELSITTDAETTTGGTVLQVGNNAGNDQVWRIHKRLIAFDVNKLYRVRVRVKRTAGSGTFYAGVAGVAADGVTLVNITGAANSSSQYYTAASGETCTSTFVEYIGYIKGSAASGAGGKAPLWSSPAKMYSTARYLRPLFIANYSAQAGKHVLDYFIIEEVALDSQGRPSELFSGDQNATYGADMANNLLNRYAIYLLRSVSDPAALEQIIANLNNSGQPANQRFYRANFLAMNSTMRSAGTITASSGPSTATITVNAWTIQTDTGVISYNSGTISGLALSTPYYVYCIDATLQGGALTYYATSDINVLSQNSNYVYCGKITTPAASGNTTGGGRWDTCVAADSYMPHDLRACDVVIGSRLRVLDYATFAGVIDARCDAVGFDFATCVRIVCENGAAVVCAISTPITCRNGSIVDVWQALHQELPTEIDGVFAWSRVLDVERIGIRPIAHISCGGRTYAAGDKPGAYVLTHNAAKP